MIVTSCPKRVMIARNQFTVVMWAPCPWSHPTGKECNVVTKRIPIVLGHFVNRTVLHKTGHRNDKSYLCLPNHLCKRRSFAHVDLRAAMFSVPSCAWVDSSGRLFHDLSRKHADNPRVQNTMRETIWDVEQTKNRLPFHAKTTVQI